MSGTRKEEKARKSKEQEKRRAMPSTFILTWLSTEKKQKGGKRKAFLAL